MTKIKNSKFKNTGILFELLCTQMTMEVLASSPKTKALELIKKYFGPKTALRKELFIYQSLLKEKFKSKELAQRFIETATELHEKLDKKKLVTEKYNLVKEINTVFDSNFYEARVFNYKELASIYKVLEHRTNTTTLPDLFKAKETLLEHITTSPTQTTTSSKISDILNKEDMNVRIIAYRQMVESFNKNYRHLNQRQRQLLKEYIVNVTNPSFKTFLISETRSLQNELITKSKAVKDETLQIKINGIVESLKTYETLKNVDEKNVLAVLKIYQLIEELENVS